MSKIYQVDRLDTETHVDHNGRTVRSEVWKVVQNLKASRTSRVLAQAERMYPGAKLRARLITGGLPQ